MAISVPRIMAVGPSRARPRRTTRVSAGRRVRSCRRLGGGCGGGIAAGRPEDGRGNRHPRAEEDADGNARRVILRGEIGGGVGNGRRRLPPLHSGIVVVVSVERLVGVHVGGAVGGGEVEVRVVLVAGPVGRRRRSA